MTVTRAPLRSAPKNYLRSTGIADTVLFGPEPEFFLFDDIRFGSSISSSTLLSTISKAHGTPPPNTKVVTKVTVRQ
ncbi:hypothetical protein ACLBR5_01770 [Escherichia coli]